MAQTETQAAAQDTAVDATENNETTAETTEQAEPANTEAAAAAPEEPEEISYHAVEKEGHVTAIWEMQGRKHLRTIDPRSSEGKNILSLFTSDHHEEDAAA
jgi:hypothetical protein